MPNLLPMIFIALGALALVATLYYLWQSIREALEASETGVVSAAEQVQVVSPERASLLAEKHSLLVALRDLDAEKDSGKLSSDDFTELSQRYRVRAREVLRLLDEQLAPHRPSAKAMLAGALAQEAKTSTPSRAPVESASGACEKCGTSNDADAVFCKKCGARVGAEQGA